jgi:serine/threonine protein kinase
MLRSTIASFPVVVGDLFLLTTVGVHEHMDGTFVLQTLADGADLQEAAEQIATAALKQGSRDNLTVQVVRVDSLPSPDETDLFGGVTDLPLSALPRAGDVIDNFRILRLLHSSSRSHVFLASAPDGARVAIKIPSAELRENQNYLRRFMLEEWIARRISSSHVLRPTRPPERRSSLYVITEFIEGQTLRQWMNDNPSPTPDQVRDFVDQIARGLRAFHRREMVHQDLRPENIMIDGDGTVRIIDFGSVSVAGVEEAMPGVAGEALGTFQFTAPEYLSGDAVSWRSDQYSLGVIAYEMLTGRLPYGAQAAKVRTRAEQRRLSYRPATDDKHAVPDWMDKAIRKAAHPDPLRRYDALSEFVADLRSPGVHNRARRHLPLLERNPVRFWQCVSFGLSIIIVILAARLSG